MTPQLAIDASGRFAAFTGRAAFGRDWRHALVVRAACATPNGVIVIDARGDVLRLAHQVELIWHAGPVDEPCAVAPDGTIFDGTVIRDRTGRHDEPYTIDFFERWTYAAFAPTGELVLAFESGQPWSEGGSYGDRLWGIEVIAGGRCVAIDYDMRGHDERFEPTAASWHPRGVVAWANRDLTSYVMPGARDDVGGLLPDRDARNAELVLAGPLHALAIDPGARYVGAIGDGLVRVVDLELGRVGDLGSDATAIAFDRDAIAQLCGEQRGDDIELASMHWQPLE